MITLNEQHKCIWTTLTKIITYGRYNGLQMSLINFQNISTVYHFHNSCK